MIDYALKFPDEATATEVLEPIVTTHRIDVIGVIQEPSGKTIKTADGLVPVMAPIPGWHVNVRGDEVEGLTKYQVFPSAPVRGWA